jgi:NTE family protein
MIGSLVALIAAALAPLRIAWAPLVAQTPTNLDQIPLYGGAKPQPGRCRSWHRVIAVGLGLMTALLSDAAAQTRRAPVALVLSGGGAGALAHIGVLKVLDEIGLSVDIVVGSGVGGLIGGLYAAGYSAGEIERFAEDLDWKRIMRDPVDRRDFPVGDGPAERYYLLQPLSQDRLVAPGSLLARRRLETVLRKQFASADSLPSFDDFRTPFRTVAVDLFTEEPVVFTRGSLSEAVLVSMAMPRVFAPGLVGGRALQDGGLAMPLPGTVARASGAAALVCSDVTRSLELEPGNVRFFDRFARSLSLQSQQLAQGQLAQCDVAIAPDISGVSSLEFERAPEIIARGEGAARQAMSELRRLGDAAR